MRRIEPADRLVLIGEETHEEVSAGGLILIRDEHHKEAWRYGKVLATGPDCKEVQAGQTVMYPKFKTEEFDLDGEHYWLIDEKDITGVWW